MNTIRVSNSLDPDQARRNLIWVQTVCRSYQQTTLEGKKGKKYMHMYGPSILFLYRNLYGVCERRLTISDHTAQVSYLIRVLYVPKAHIKLTVSSYCINQIKVPVMAFNIKLRNSQ